MDPSPFALGEFVAALFGGKPGVPGSRSGSGGRPLLVGIAGSVAVGKTNFARQLIDMCNEFDPHVAQIVSTDGFLFPNSVLERRSLLERKGFPESYDSGQMLAFAEQTRAGMWPIVVPSYSHETFDIGLSRELDASQIVVVEGINALQAPLGEVLDVAIYLHADEVDIRRWFVERLLALIAAAKQQPGGFYDRFVDWPVAEQRAFATKVWDAINLPNLRQHIAPSRANAHWVLTFDDQHRVIDVERQ